MKVKLTSKGNWYKTVKFLEHNKYLSQNARRMLYSIAQEGVDALSRYTPKDTGLASSSWGYKIEIGKDRSKIIWENYDIEGGYNVAILIQYGHGLKHGGYIEGRDFVNPAIRPIFDNFVDALWKEVTNA